VAPAPPILVLGASGSFGGAVAQELLRRREPVRALVRDPEKARRALGESPDLELIEGDVQDETALARAAEGCRAVVHGVNYRYDRWVPHMRTATTSVIAAARAAGAIILFPGNVYGLGAQTGRLLDEATPDAPCSRKGALRVELESALRAATDDGRTRVLVLRAGDYFGPTVRNGLVDPIFGNAARGRTVWALGDLSIAHQWAFVPDLASAAVDALAIAPRLPRYEVIHFAGHLVTTQRDFLRLVAHVAGHPTLPIRAIPWWLLRLAGMFNGVVRELLEMRYLFDRAVILDDTRLRRLWPGHRDTPLPEAVRLTLESYRASDARRDSAPVT
jgi:nucleoside-diphosphate-sugar epimerase